MTASLLNRTAISPSVAPYTICESTRSGPMGIDAEARQCIRRQRNEYIEHWMACGRVAGLARSGLTQAPPADEHPPNPRVRP